MKIIYGLLFIAALLGGLFFMFAAKSAVHEIEGLILFLIAAVMIVAAEVREMAENQSTRAAGSKQKKSHETGGD